MESRDEMIPMKRFGSVRGWLLAAGVAAVMASPGLGKAQSTGQITGTVMSQEGQPIPGATVTVAGTGISALTNAGGRYLLSNVPVGPQTVNARVIGYGEETQQVRDDG